MKEYITNFFTAFGCSLREQEHVLTVELTPELTQHFGKPSLRLVFHTNHLKKQTELVTHGSYITGRIYDIIQHIGGKVSVLLPKIQESPGSLLLNGINCLLTKQRSREVRRTNVYHLFRVTYYSDEKVEEIITTRRDFTGKLSIHTGFPYTPTLLQEAAPYRFPFTQKQAKTIYDKCLHQVHLYAERQAGTYQEKLAKHFHENLTRLEAYYHQMIEEVPALEKNRQASIRQLQDEYEIKVSDELKKCQIQVTITPISFCAITIPFRRYTYTFRRNEGEVQIEVYVNLYSGEKILPHCESCGHDMAQIGICDVHGHPVCRNCLVTCHECGKSVCRDCGIEICFECGEWVCDACSKRCHLCGERHCGTHLLGCTICREHFCQQCSDLCEHCGKPVGKIHLTACEINYTLICPACTAICSCCQKNVNHSLINSCTFCGQQACTECTFRCYVCGEEFCVHHVSECEITKQMVCLRHSGTCQQCGRHVSTTCLNTCDVCGQTICTHCSTQCHGCGIFFCREHAKEMAHCPECKEIYCVLCYPGQGLCEACQGSKGAGH